MAEGGGPPPTTNTDSHTSPATPGPSNTNGVGTPGPRSSKLPPLPPPMTPLVRSVSARVMADAEKKLSELQSEIDALKKRDTERENVHRNSLQQHQNLGLTRRPHAGALGQSILRPPAGHMFPSYPDYEESADCSELVTAAEKQRMEAEMQLLYEHERAKMQKNMQLVYRQRQRELEMIRSKKSFRRRKTSSLFDYGRRDKNDYSDSDDSDSSDDDDRSSTAHLNDEEFDKLRRSRAKVDVVICTTEGVPGYRPVQHLGPFKVVVPRSLLCDDDSPEEIEGALNMAKIVRQEVFDKAMGVARRRRANAIVNFKFKTEMSKSLDDDNVVLITATGNCYTVRRMVSEREAGLRRMLEDSRKRYRRDRDVEILREAINNDRRLKQKASEARAMDPRDLQATLAEWQSKAKAKEKEKENDPGDVHKDLLEKLLGQKVRLDGDPYTKDGGGGVKPRDMSANVVQDLLAKLMTGNAGGALDKLTDQIAGRYSSKQPDIDRDKEDDAVYSAYD